jgi:hypothetical protein
MSEHWVPIELEKLLQGSDDEAVRAPDHGPVRLVERHVVVEICRSALLDHRSQTGHRQGEPADV